LIGIVVRIYASIRSRPVRIARFAHSGWRLADDDDENARELPFEFRITDDGAGEFLLVYRSIDGTLSADTSHTTLDAAFSSAERQFGISRKEWTNA
jgi:hypothetical protein